MLLLGAINEFQDEERNFIDINGLSLLLIHHQQKFYLIANQCGHFGAALDDATIQNNEIICSQHGISFNLSTGLIVNRPYETCDPIKTYDLLEKNGQLYCLNL